MNGIVRITVAGIRAAGLAYGRKWAFLALFLLVLAGSVAMLARLDLLPGSSSTKATESAVALDTVAPAARVALRATVAESPVKIKIPAIGLSATVANPTATDNATLDAWLLKGAVRYPTSAKLGEDGNVVLFGHSSYLPIVHNLAYKTFDDIQKLSAGDVITVSSSDTAYTYRVRSVVKMNANDGVIPLSVEGRVLTLATCNSFATKSDRFVVTADFVESHPFGA
ncbi:MAG: sortase [bacterium]|nr:sortase [bacterium]